MCDVVEEYNLQVDRLRKLLKSRRAFREAMELALEIHGVTHRAAVSGSPVPTFCDRLLDGLEEEDYSVMPTEKDETIAWHLWHIARIEDLVGNLLIAEGKQVFDDKWMDRMKATVKDTGNAMSDEEIIGFSRQVDKQGLIEYRDAVGRRTRELLKSLTVDDLKRKPGGGALERVVEEGGLLECKESIWLKDFWGRHTVAGLIVLPLTRHHMMHLPDSIKIKRFIKNDRI